MKPGVTLAQAQSDVDGVATRIRDEHLSDVGFVAHVIPLRERLVGGQRAALLVLFGAVGFVLLIACANVAMLFLSRARARQREMSIRAALGAGRFRVVRQLLTESMLVAALGGAVGVLLAAWIVDLIPRLTPSGFPRIDEVSLDGTVLAFTSVLAILTGVGFGLAPALQPSGQELVSTLKEGTRGATVGRSARRIRSGLVVGNSPCH